MNKYALITLCVGDDYKSMIDLISPRMKKYAEKYMLDFEIITNKVQEHPAYNKLQLLNYIDKYSRILFLDADVIIRNDAPNIFEVVPENHLGIFNEEYLKICNCGQETIDEYNKLNLTQSKYNGNYYNTGVMIFDKNIALKIFDQNYKTTNEFFADQGYINYMIQLYNVPCYDIGYKFNGLNHGNLIGDEKYYNSYFIHMNGNGTFKNKYEFLKNDIEKLKQIERILSV